MVPPAPVGFSTITDWPSETFIRSARMRASVSLGPPAGYGTTMLIVRDGKLSASALPTSAATMVNAAMNDFVTTLSQMIDRSSLRLDVGSLDDRPPFVDFGLLLGGERLRRLMATRPTALTDFVHALLHGRVGQRFHHHGMELGDHILGRALGRPEAVPERGVKPGDASFFDGRRVRRGPPAFLGHDRESLDFAGAILR